MDLNVIIAVCTVVSSLAAVSAIWVSLSLHSRQSALSEKLSRDHDALAQRINGEQIEMQKMQTLLTQRQLLIPIWDIIGKLRRIDHANINWDEVTQSANTLELIALCWEGQLIDERLIRRTFRDTFITLWREIGQCNSNSAMPHGQKNGPQLQQENKAAARLYRILTEEHENQDLVPPLASR